MTASYPNWPRGLSAELAATYVGLSKSGFLADDTIPAAIQLTKGRKVWLREDLDAWLDAKAGKVQSDQTMGSLTEELREWRP